MAGQRAGGPRPWIGPASHALGGAAAATADLGWAGQRGRRAWAALTASTHARLSARSAACAAPRRRGQTKGAEGRSEGGRLREGPEGPIWLGEQGGGRAGTHVRACAGERGPGGYACVGERGGPGGQTRHRRSTTRIRLVIVIIISLP